MPVKRIPVTRGFDGRDPIGYLVLREDVEIMPTEELTWSYFVLAGTRANPTKIQVQELHLIPRVVVPIKADN